MPRILFTLLCAAAVGGCSTTLATMAVHDAQLAARVKTALVNDPQVGTRPIEVRATGGVVSLVGRVDSAAQAQRAVEIAKAVPGVVDVISDLQTVAAPPPGSAVPPPGAAPPQADRDRPGWTDPDAGAAPNPQLLAVGVSLRRSGPSAEALGPDFTFGPLVRLGSGRGWGPAVGFGWFSADWHLNDTGGPLVGHLRVRPFMAGLAYGFRGTETSLSLSLVGGVAFNSVSLPRTPTVDQTPIDAAASFAVRPGASLWFDVSRRIAVNLGGSYLVTRPRVRVMQDGAIHRRAVRADAVLVTTGIVYKLF